MVNRAQYLITTGSSSTHRMVINAQDGHQRPGWSSPHNIVIPANAGIQFDVAHPREVGLLLDSRWRGNDVLAQE
ncbi:MAG: hypothetical protein WD737_08165 [Gemmatimonadota bacterium]